MIQNVHAYELPRRIGPAVVAVRTVDQAVADVAQSVEGRVGRIFGFYNAHTVNLARSSAEFARTLEEITLLNDGIGVEIASKVLHGRPFPVNLNGTDLTPKVLAGLPAKTRIFLLGSTEEVVSAAAGSLSRRFPSLVLCGSHHGFFNRGMDAEVLRVIAEASPDLILVGMGQPQQEYWAVSSGVRTGATQMCVGAYLDFAAGRFSRAPEVVRQMRLEWLYRLMLEPRRLWRRYLVGNVTFLFYLLRLRFRGNVDNFG